MKLKTILIYILEYIAVFAFFIIIRNVVQYYNDKEIDMFSFIVCGNLCISIILFIICFIYSKGAFIKKKEKFYIRDFEAVISPLYAESIINKQVNFKELLIAFLLDMIRRKHMNVIDDDTLEFIDSNDLSPLEKKIVHLLFSKRYISFSELNQDLQEKIKRKDIIKKLYSIKNDIRDKLTNDEYYDLKKEKRLKYLRLLVLLFLSASMVIPFLIGANYESQGDFIELQMFAIAGFSIITMFFMHMETEPIIFSYYDNMIEYLLGEIAILLSVFILFIPFLIITFIFSRIYIVFFVAWIFSILIYYVSIHVTFTHMFTEKGKEEYKKVRGLRNYIVDYSIIKERDMQDLIIWDGYLVYAAAFGIPNKVYKRFSDKIVIENKLLKRLNRN